MNPNPTHKHNYRNYNRYGGDFLLSFIMSVVFQSESMICWFYFPIWLCFASNPALALTKDPACLKISSAFAQTFMFACRYKACLDGFPVLQLQLFSTYLASSTCLWNSFFFFSAFGFLYNKHKFQIITIMKNYNDSVLC